MKTTIVYLALILALLTNLCSAGQGWYLTIDNDLPHAITLNHFSSKCWQINDLQQKQVIAPQTLEIFYLEEINSGLCLVTEHNLELKINLADAYVGRIKLSAPFALMQRLSQVYINNEIKERNLAHLDSESQVQYSIKASDLCHKDLVTYLSCGLQ